VKTYILENGVVTEEPDMNRWMIWCAKNESHVNLTVEDILNRLFARVKQRRKAGCCTMSTVSLDPLVHWGEHSDPESAGEEVVKVLKELGYNIISYYVERELVDEEDRIITEKEEWEVRAVQVSFDWITKT